MYQVILADPPWRFKKGSKRSGDKWWGTVEQHYDSMSTKEICALPVSDLIAENAVLFLWSVWPAIDEGISVIESWGFTYRTAAWVWLKTKKRGLLMTGTAEDLRMGFGYYTRAVSEPCLLGVRGAMRPSDRSVRAVIIAPIGGHSAKPDEQYAMIERLYPDARKLEMFARKRQPGWDVWGHEAPVRYRSREAYQILGEPRSEYAV